MKTPTPIAVIPARYPNLITTLCFISKLTPSQAATVVWAVKNNVNGCIGGPRVALFGGPCNLIAAAARHRNA